MENNNQTIKSASNLTEIKNIITELKKIFSRDEKYKKQLEILVDSEKYIEELESKDEDESYNLKKEDVMNDSIEKLYEKIRKYELFYQLYNFSESLNQEMLYTNENNIYDLTNKCIEMHTKLLHSDFEDYKIADYLLPIIYECIYNGMKREIIFSDYKRLFYAIKDDKTKTSHPYIAKLIENDIIEIESEELLMQLNYLKSKGLDSGNIIDLDLLTSITKKTMNNIKIDCKENLLEDINSYENIENEIKESEEKHSNVKLIVKEDEQEKRKALRSVINKLAIYGMNVALVFGVGAGTHLLEKKFSREYYTTTTTYNSETGEYNTSEPEYEIKASYPIIITKEDPWKKETFFKTSYRKYIHIYNLVENEDCKDLIDYIDYLIETDPSFDSSTSTTVSEKPKEFGNEETVYIVEKKEYDENNYKDIDLKNHLFLPILFSLFAGVIDLSLLAIKYIYDCNNLKARLNNHKRTKRNLISDKKLLQEKKKEIEDLKNQREKLYEEIISQYNKLPKYIQEDNQVNATIQKIKK